MKEYLDMWRNYANFSGKTSVRGFWIAILFSFIASTVLAIIGEVVPFLSLLINIYSLAIIIPSLSIAVRRFHDANKKWTCILLPLIPIVGGIIYIVKLCTPTAVDQSVESV